MAVIIPWLMTMDLLNMRGSRISAAMAKLDHQTPTQLSVISCSTYYVGTPA